MTHLISRAAVLGLVVLLLVGTGCFQKRKPLVPLPLDGDVRPQVLTLTEQGTQAYQTRQYEEAKRYFEQAVTEAPQSGPAHYNYALALNALGDSEVARKHFLQAADLSPGDKVIWDSPALSPYGNPEDKNKKKPGPYTPRRSSFGSGMPGGY
ncbi:MAG: tetratricopeptide repeat protein [Nitrospira sp.]|jgi:tetratricopeptide (TPR) repeat protein|nr:tetratricopeptide repeat protein [Nitrospira sp.]